MDALVKPENDLLNRDLRRYQVRLRVTAAGVLIFAFWGIIRNVLMTILRSDDKDSITSQSNAMLDELSKEMTSEQIYIVAIVFVIFLVVLLTFDTILRVRIFQLARREARDPSVKRRMSYIVMAWLLILGSIYSIFNMSQQIYKGEYGAYDGIISIIVEVTSMATLGELIEAVLKLRKLRDKQKLVCAEAACSADQPEQLEKQLEPMDEISDNLTRLQDDVDEKLDQAGEKIRADAKEVHDVIKEAAADE